MSVWAVLPVKPAEEGKSRLAEALTQAARTRLNRRLFRHTLNIVSSVFPPERVIVVSRDSALLGIAAAIGAQAVTEYGEGLNEALTQAAALLPPRADLLAISTDLPTLTAEDLRAMLDAPGPVIIAPDRAGQGTNALLTRPAGSIPYRFGENSFRRHAEAAARSGLAIHAVHRPGLAFDLDMPEDLPLCPATILD
jgi:2-phospho-L-lactate/phosphoenolpyruvate guanylyltransferase